MTICYMNLLLFMQITIIDAKKLDNTACALDNTVFRHHSNGADTSQKCRSAEM